MYLLIVGSHYCVMRFAYTLHMCQKNFVLFPCLQIEFFELVIKVIFHYCTTPPCLKIDLFKRPFRDSRSERLDNASVLLVSLISFTLRKSLFLSDELVHGQIVFIYKYTCKVEWSHNVCVGRREGVTWLVHSMMWVYTLDMTSLNQERRPTSDNANARESYLSRINHVTYIHVNHQRVKKAIGKTNVL